MSKHNCRLKIREGLLFVYSLYVSYDFIPTEKGAFMSDKEFDARIEKLLKPNGVIDQLNRDPCILCSYKFKNNEPSYSCKETPISRQKNVCMKCCGLIHVSLAPAIRGLLAVAANPLQPNPPD